MLRKAGSGRIAVIADIFGRMSSHSLPAYYVFGHLVAGLDFPEVANGKTPPGITVDISPAWRDFMGRVREPC